MAGFLLHLGATVLCAHGGQVQLVMGNPRVHVGGQPVVTQPLPHTIAGCPFTVPPAVRQPCVTAQWVSAAARVKVMGQPVLLHDSQTLCVPNDIPALIVMTQIRVKGM